MFFLDQTIEMSALEREDNTRMKITYQSWFIRVHLCLRTVASKLTSRILSRIARYAPVTLNDP